MLDTLQMVRTREPVSPTDLQPKVPGDLETICLKCLQKDPARRYASAAAVAEDVRRYLGGEPILARPVGVWERFGRWCRRNPRVAGLSAAVVLLLIVWATTSSGLAYIAFRNQQLAEENERRKIEEAARADAKAKEATENARIAQKNADISGNRQQKAATQYFRDALELGEGLVKSHPGDFSFKADLVEVYGAQGEALLHLGRDEEARASYQRAREYLDLSLARNPDNPEQQPYSALLHERLGGMARRRGQRDEAKEHYREALKIREDLALLHPDHLMWQAAYVVALAHGGRHAEAARLADDLRRRAGQSPLLLLQVARCHAICASAGEPKQNHTSKALEVLQVLIALEFRDPVLLRTDPDLASLQKDPAFRALLAKME